MNEKAKEQLKKLLKAFKKPEQLVDDIKISTIRRLNNHKPSDSWSLCNRLLMMIHGTNDARGYLQWQKVGRYVKKGAKAFHILAPLWIKIEEETENGEIIEKSVLRGFRPVAVFRLEDTEGKPVEYPDYSPPELPPLFQKAKEWNIDVKWEPFQSSKYGSYNISEDSISLQSYDWHIFFHELAHATHKRVRGDLKGGQQDDQETVAEITAAVLGRLFGKKTDKQTWNYINNYNKNLTWKIVTSVLSDVEKCLDLILGENDAN